MLEQKMKDIITLAHSIDVRINLFEGYVPKNTETYKGELLFWREIVSIYGLFADCDRAQIKERKNLFELMNRYSLIERNEYDYVKLFWDDISNLRKWFCHNNDLNRFFVGEKQEKITLFLDKAFTLSTDKPKSMEEVKQKDWSILCFNIESRFDEYITILNKGLISWKESEDREEICGLWMEILSVSLFNDIELIMNVLADIAAYKIMDENIRGIGVQALSRQFLNQLKEGEFSEKDIERELRIDNCKVRSNKDIVYQSIINSNLI